MGYWLKTWVKKPDGDKKESEKKDGDSKEPAQTTDAKETSAKPDVKPSETEAPKITLDILDASGKVIRHFPKKEEEGEQDEAFGAPDRNARTLPADAGLNRFVWDLDYEGASKGPHAHLLGGSTSRPRPLPATCQMKLTVLRKAYT